MSDESLRCEQVPACVREQANRIMSGLRWLTLILTINLAANLAGRVMDVRARDQMAIALRNLHAMRSQVEVNQRVLQLLEDERDVERQRLNVLTERFGILRRRETKGGQR